VQELRCGSHILHGILEDDLLEVVCKSRWCGKRDGVVVLHYFNKYTGDLVETKKYSEPKEGARDGSR